MDNVNYKNRTVDMVKVLRNMIDGTEDPKHEPTREELRKRRSIRNGIFSIDPETYSLYYMPVEKYDVGIQIPLGNTQYFKMAELLVKRGNELISHKEMYEYIFGRPYDDDSEPTRKLQYFINRFKARLNKDPKRKFKKKFLDYLFTNAYGQGYMLHNKM